MTARRVLVVDDDADLRLLACHVLRSVSPELVINEAADGVEAVGVAWEEQPDLILLDIAMPRLDGVAALPLLREAAPAARIVIVSAYTHWRGDTVEHGADGFIAKPYGRGEIERLVSCG